MRTIKGPAIFLAQFAGDAPPFNTLRRHRRMGRRPRLQGRADPDLGRRACSIWRRPPRARPTATRSRASWRDARPRDHRAVDAPAGPAGRGASGLRRRRSTASRRPQVRGNPKARQEWAVRADAAGGQGVAATSGSTRTRPSPARWPGPISIPGRSGPPGLIEDRVRRAGASAGGRSSTPSTTRASTSATRSIRARTCTTARPSRCSSSASATTRALQHPLRPEPLRAAAARLSRLHRHLPRAHQDVPRQGRRVQSDRPAGRLLAAIQPWMDRAGRFRSLGDGQVDFGAHLLQARAVRLRRLGGARMGMLPQASRGRRARRRAVHRATTSSASPRRRSTTSPAARTTRPTASMLGSPGRCSKHTARRTAGGCASAWSAAARAPSSAACIASPRASTTATSSSPARSRRTPDKALRAARRSACASALLLRLRGDGASAKRRAPDGIEAVAIVTPNHMHHAVAKAFLEAGIHVICDKPLTTTLADAAELVQRSPQRTRPRLRADPQLHAAIRWSGRRARWSPTGELGDDPRRAGRVRAGLADDAAGSDRPEAGRLAHRSEALGAGGASATSARMPSISPSFVTGCEVDRSWQPISATFVAGRQLDDNVHVLLRFANGARGMLWASQVAPGNENGLRLRVYGEQGRPRMGAGAAEPAALRRYGQPPRIIARGGPGLSPIAAAAARIPAGHPEGYLEGFAQLTATSRTRSRRMMRNLRRRPAHGWCREPQMGCVACSSCTPQSNRAAKTRRG